MPTNIKLDYFIMKIVAGMQVFEEEDFIRETLISLLTFCDHVVVVEGCWRNTESVTGCARSRDKTIQFIKDIMENHDPSGKIELHFFNGDNQRAHRIHALSICSKFSPDWYLQADGDEIFHENDVPKLVKLMKETKKTAINPNHRLFWNDLEHYEQWRGSGRFFRLTGLSYSRLNYLGCNCYGYGGDTNYFRGDNMDVPLDINIYHPSYVKNFERQRVKWAHRSMDDRSKFPHVLDDRLKMVYRAKAKSADEWQNMLETLPSEDLPKFFSVFH